MVEKMIFDPPKISAHVGDTIEWASSDFVVHTATAKNKDGDVTIPAKGIGRVTLEHPGEVAYFCRFSPQYDGTDFSGTVRVTFAAEGDKIAWTAHEVRQT